MNRRERRAAKAQGNHFVAKCAMCAADACELHVLAPRAIYVGAPTAPKDVGICKGCPCSAGRCDVCGETEGHWLGCRLVGMQERPPTGAVMQ